MDKALNCMPHMCCSCSSFPFLIILFFLLFLFLCILPFLIVIIKFIMWIKLLPTRKNSLLCNIYTKPKSIIPPEIILDPIVGLRPKVVEQFFYSKCSFMERGIAPSRLWCHLFKIKSSLVEKKGKS